MVYTTTDIDKVLSYKTWSNKRKSDELLRMDCNMYCNLGLDSTKSERTAVRVVSRKIYSAIKTVDDSLGTLLIQTIDPKK